MSIEIRQPSSRPGQLVNEIHKLPAWCENLVRVEEESGTTEFAHKAVYEFIAEGLSGPDFTEFHFKLEDADHEVGEICVTYLHFSDFVTTMTQRPQPVRIDPAAMARSALQNSRHLPKSISSAIMKSHKSAQTKTDVAGVLATYNRSDNAEPINALQDQHPFLKYASVHWISHTTRFSSLSQIVISQSSDFLEFSARWGLQIMKSLSKKQ
ncbi:hypothetical protein LX36DRAFT_668289 [Colletotrichum falcatum]|nr:hypothetical protein LX36DRAFT_668289 [Colletotrichum falcatum]